MPTEASRATLHGCSFYPGCVVPRLSARRLLRLRGGAPDPRHRRRNDDPAHKTAGVGRAGRPMERRSRSSTSTSSTSSPPRAGARRRLGIRKARGLRRAGVVAGLATGRVRLLASNDRYSLWTIRADGSGGRRLAQSADEATPSVVAGRFEDRIRQASARTTSEGFSSLAPTGRACARSARAAAASPQGIRPGRPTGSCSTAAPGFVTPRSPTSSPSRRAARVGRALTHPFPTGGTNDGPQGLVGAQLTGQEQLPPTIAVTFKRKTTSRGPFDGSPPTARARCQHS